MKNSEIAEIFNNIADILEIKNENRFRIRAYRKAAETLENLTKDLEEVARSKALTDLAGIGKDLAGKIEEYIKKGKIKAYEDLKKSIPKPILQLITIPGVGPNRAKLLCDKLKIKNIKQSIYLVLVVNISSTIFLFQGVPLAYLKVSESVGQRILKNF